jgi:hypothetical protein
MLLIAAANEVDSRALQILRNLNDVKVVEDAPQSVAITEGDVYPVQIDVVEAGEIDARLAAGEFRDASLFVVNAVLDDEAAAKLEDANVSYIDVTGRRWLRSWTRTKRSRESVAGGRRRLYAPSVRLAQLLADRPDEPWTERGLAQRGQTTQTTAHRLLSRLEKEGLVRREGHGPATMRWVQDPYAMRSWLAQEGRPRRAARLSCYVPDFERGTTGILGRALALTGAAGAAAIGLPVLTREVRPAMRVNVAAIELEDVPEALGGFRADSGANLTLIADPDRLAFIDPRSDRNGRLMAPPSRIMLDLYLEPRGEAAAEVFLNLWGRREVAG